MKQPGDYSDEAGQRLTWSSDDLEFVDVAAPVFLLTEDPYLA